MPEHRPPSLPWVARLLVRFTAPPRWREAFLGDLEELYAADLDAGRSRFAAGRRAVKEAGGLALARAVPGSRGLRGGSARFGTPGGGRRARASAPAQLAYDFRFAFRALRRAPGFTVLVALTLALGIGCMTAFGGLFDAVLLRPLPFPDTDTLVKVWGEDIERPGGSFNMSYPDYLDLRADADAFEELAVYHSTYAGVLRSGAAPERVPSLLTSPNFLSALDLEPVLGRDFTAEDDEAGSPPVVMLGAGYWRRAFGAAPDILGATLRINDIPRTVIGVAPDGLDFADAPDVVVPIHTLSSLDVRGVHSQQVLGRLAADASMATAQAQVDVIATRLRSAYPESNARRGVRLESLHDAIVGPSRGRLAMVSVAAIFLLLVVCANVSSLLLERSTQRQREMATRAALGASSAQLMRTLLAESLALAALGLAGALGVAWVVKSLLLTYGPELPRRVDPGLDARTFGIALATTALVGLLFTLVPSLHTLGRGLYRRLRVGLVGASGAAGRRWRSAFVTVQIALAVVLTLGAALLVQSLANLQSVDLGFTHEGVLTVDLEVPTPYVSDRWPETVAFYRDLIDELEEVPGVAAAAAAHQHPAKPGWSTSFTIEGEPTPPTGEKPEANFRPVTPGYFELLDIPLLAGRSYGDAAPPEPVGQVIVNRAFVRRHLGDVAPQRALGRRIIRDCWWNADIKSYDIIGVVADTHFAGRHRRPQPALYLPHRTDAPPRMTVLVRTEPGLAPLAQLDAVREAVLRVDPEMPLGHTATLSELVRDTVDVRRFLTFLLTAFAGVTLALAALGLYAALAFATARRTRELGLRMALGARARQVHALIWGEGLRLAAYGLAAGLAAALWASRLLESLLFGVGRADPATFLGVAAVLGVVATAAGWLPAWRATRIDPVRALADE